MPTLASINDCTGCLACADTCPFNAISCIINQEGHYSYEIDSSKCVECKKCEKACPARADYLYGNNSLNLSVPYAAWSTDRVLRQSSTSGGIFAAIAKTFLSNGDVVIGAAIVNNSVEHICIDNLNDLYKLQGSKYAQSRTFGIFRTIIKHLKDGKKVLFSGTGCQVAAAIECCKNSPYYKNLFTVDLICGGVPSTFLISKYCEQYGEQVSEIYKFRNKSKYEFSIKDKNGNIKVIPLKDRPLPLCGFYTELTNRYCCYDCKFAFAHRVADLTIGDLWGDTQFENQHKDGLSVVVTHNTRGLELIKKSEIEFHAIKWNDFLLHNHRMVYGKSPLGETIAREKMAIAFREYSYDRLLQDYANYATIKEPLSFVYKIIRYLKGKIVRRQIVKNVNKIINQL